MTKLLGSRFRRRPPARKIHQAACSCVESRFVWRSRRKFGGVCGLEGIYQRRLMLASAVFAVGLSAPTAQGAVESMAAKGLAAERSETLADAIDLVRGETGGRVLSVTPLADREKSAGYRVRLLLDGGRVTTVEIDDSGDLRNGR